MFKYLASFFLKIKLLTCFFFSPSVLQSKDIGVQMHEELVKVTNELYTVSCPLMSDLSLPFPSVSLRIVNPEPFFSDL